MERKRKVKRRVKKSKEDWIYDVVIYTIAVLLLVITLYPMYFVIIASISNPTSVSAGEITFWPKGINFKGYQELFKYKKLWIGYRNTILYTVLGTIATLVVNIPAGYALTRKELIGKKGIMIFYLIPMFFTGGLIPTYMIIQNFKLLNTVWVMIIPFSVVVYYIIVIRTFFENSIPEDLWEAAQIDGCGTLGFFFKIALPLSKAVIAVIALWAAVAQWNSYFNALIYLRDSELMPLQIILRNILIGSQSIATLATGSAAAEAKQMADLIKYAVIVVSSLPIMCMYPFVQKYFNKGVMIGAVKG